MNIAKNLEELKKYEDCSVNEQILNSIRMLLDPLLPNLEFDNYFDYNGNRYTITVLRWYREVRVRVEYDKNVFDCEILKLPNGEETSVGYKNIYNHLSEDIGLRDVALKYIQSRMKEDVSTYCNLPFVEYEAESGKYVNTASNSRDEVIPYFNYYVFFVTGELVVKQK